MKEIRVLVSDSIKITDKVVALGPAMEQVRLARTNGEKVIHSVTSMERNLERIIIHFFFGQQHPKKELFSSLILHSDWCSFRAKRNLILFIVRDGQRFNGRKYDEFQALIRKAMSYRNAFTHGEIVGGVDDVTLHFFEGDPKEVALTDEYWTQLEKDLSDCHAMIQELEVSLGVRKPAGE